MLSYVTLSRLLRLLVLLYLGNDGLLIFFFKQKTAYDMRISDWSSDVCSSDLTVPGIGLSPDKMLLGRAFAYNDAQRNRIGTNFHQLPVNRPKVPVNTYMFDGQMAYEHSGNAPVYVPNSGGRNWSDETGPVADGWEADGEMVDRKSTRLNSSH